MHYQRSTIELRSQAQPPSEVQPSTPQGASSSQTAPSTTVTQPPSLQTETPALKDYIPLPFVALVLSAVIGIIWTLIQKWKEAEIKIIQKEKEAEVKILQKELENKLAINHLEKEAEIRQIKQQQERELAEKDNKLQTLEAELKSLIEVTTIAPLNYLKETKPVLEGIIEDYNRQIQQLHSENNQLSEDKADLYQELERKLSSFENNLQKLSALEKHLSGRSKNIQKAKRWLEQHQNKLVQESCCLTLERLSYIVNDEDCIENDKKYTVERKKLQFEEDVFTYLQLVGEALRIGRTNILDKANSTIKPVFHPVVYAEVFKVIKEKLIPSSLSDPNAIREVNIYLDHLIKMFKIGLD